MHIQKGDRAPNFELPCCDGEEHEDVSLDEILNRGTTVLAFFPLAFSSVCTEELCEFRDALSELEQLDAQVYGISVDSPFVQNEFIRKENLNFPLFSDFNREAINAYGVKHDELLGLEGVAKRSVFVLDQAGNVRYSWVTDDPSNKPDLDEIKNVLNEI